LSPDPDYDEKLEYLSSLIEDVRSSEGRSVLLYLDELSYYRQPTLSRSYEQQGHHQPLAFRSTKWDVLSRVAAMLDVTSGRVIFHSGSKAGIAELVELYRKAREIYPDAERIYVAQDNWPIHFHPDVLVALEPQECKWPMYRLKSWPDEPKPSAVRKWGNLNLPIQIVPLPTYAPWTNYTEKLWRWLKQDVLHMHKLADKLDELHVLVNDFLNQFSDHSDELLRYTGLLTPD
jgi:transposase